MADELKVEPGKVPAAPPEGGPAGASPAAAAGPSAEELKTQNDKLLKDLEDRDKKLKESDGKISEMATTIATIEKRMSEVKPAGPGPEDKEVQEKMKAALEKAAYDPDGAAAEMSAILNNITSNVSQGAVRQAQAAILIQTKLAKLEEGVRRENPAFDDDIVRIVMDTANAYAGAKNPDGSSKYKTPEEAIKDATAFVKSKLDAYATKAHAAPALPPGAQAEGGPNAPPVAPVQPEKMPTAEEEIGERQKGQQRRII